MSIVKGWVSNMKAVQNGDVIKAVDNVANMDPNGAGNAANTDLNVSAALKTQLAEMNQKLDQILELLQK